MSAPSISLSVISTRIIRCHRCPELRAYCAEVARIRRRAFADQNYYGKPVPGFGDPHASILIVGLAPAAHGANRTGRMFTGDRSGDFLYSALHRAGFANQPTSVSIDDGLSLKHIYISASLRCAPPANKPTPAQLANCRSYLVSELKLLKPRVILVLGGIALASALNAVREFSGARVPAFKFQHAAEYEVADARLLCCYHVSQQNTFTGRLTPAMIDSVLRRVRRLAGLPATG
ncbi:MAG TPA: uracil-DNA glycosylase [Phycisphaerales bacterium]|nr:uracil-DNA glycosylase [Phycisphaerales bacterium]